MKQRYLDMMMQDSQLPLQLHDIPHVNLLMLIPSLPSVALQQCLVVAHVILDYEGGDAC